MYSILKYLIVKGENMDQNVHDKGYKSILQNPRNFNTFLRSFIDEKWVNDIDSNNLSLINKEYIF